MRRRLSLAAVLAGVTLIGESALAQVVVPPHPTEPVFRGLHRHKAVQGSAETVTITDGKTYQRISEQNYRERGYQPDFERLPTVFVQRLPVRAFSPHDLD
ncbi:hypothetical protein ACQR0Z_02090 [Bradyrhizobium sp. HKCCYLS3077]|uniref:hypothetical protein n=1 Tax=Bradyrhizobium sp. HKCCYLS3077 TaxID=3420761 RepID=UPI003EBF5CCF